MATADSRHIISCPHCGVRFAVAASLAGRRARCDACNATFVVPAPAKPPDSSPTSESHQKSPKRTPVELIGVECRVCGTRLYGRSDQVGQKIKCPDCGAGTELPPPPPPKPKNMPAALEGEQYELWDADDQPLPSELVAAQPKLIGINCKTCGSLFYAAENQVGQQVTCPDCNARQTVPPAAKPIMKPSVLAADRETPQIDPAADPGQRPHLVPHTVGLTLAEQRKAAEYEAALARSQRTGKPMTIDKRGRPVLPRFPLLTDVITFPFTSGVPTRCFALVGGFLIWAGLLIDGVPGWANWNSGPAGALAAFGGLAETIIALPISIVWYATVSSIVVAIFSQSAVGAQRIDDWPSLNFIHSMSEMLPLGVAMVLSAMPGWVLGQLLSLERWQNALLAAGSLILGLPIVLLSQLSGNSTWELINLKVVGAAVRCPFSMILFYIQSAFLVAVSVVAINFAWQRNPYLILATSPLFVLCIIYYARLLGRLGWRLSEKITIDEPDEDDARLAGPKNYNPPRGKKPAT